MSSYIQNRLAYRGLARRGVGVDPSVNLSILDLQETTAGLGEALASLGDQLSVLNDLVANLLGPPVLNLSATVSSVAEPDTGTVEYILTVTRTGSTASNVACSWAVTGSGSNPADAADFGGVLPDGIVAISRGSTSNQFSVFATGDELVELNETFTVTISQPIGPGTTIGTAAVELTIVNDDVLPVVSIAPLDAAKAEGASGTTAFTFTASRSGKITSTSSVAYAVTGTGSNPANATDFVGGVLPSGTISFAIGETSKTLTINVQGDATSESTEQFLVTLSSPTNAQIGVATATGTIVADESPTGNTLSIAATSANKAEGDTATTAFTFTVTRLGDLTGVSGCSWAVTGSGSLPANAADFGGVLPSGTLSWAASDVVKVITVSVSGDNVFEPDEQFTVTLSSPTGTGTVLGTATAIGIILNDDPAVVTATLSLAAVGDPDIDLGVGGWSEITGFSAGVDWRTNYVTHRSGTVPTITQLPTGFTHNTSIDPAAATADKGIATISKTRIPAGDWQIKLDLDITDSPSTATNSTDTPGSYCLVYVASGRGNGTFPANISNWGSPVSGLLTVSNLTDELYFPNNSTGIRWSWMTRNTTSGNEAGSDDIRVRQVLVDDISLPLIGTGGAKADGITFPFEPAAGSYSAIISKVNDTITFDVTGTFGGVAGTRKTWIRTDPTGNRFADLVEGNLIFVTRLKKVQYSNIQVFEAGVGAGVSSCDFRVTSNVAASAGGYKVGYVVKGETATPLGKGDLVTTTPGVPEVMDLDPLATQWVVHRAASNPPEVQQTTAGVRLETAFTDGVASSQENVAIWSKRRLSGDCQISFDLAVLSRPVTTGANGSFLQLFLHFSGRGTATRPLDMSAWGPPSGGEANFTPGNTLYGNDGQGLRFTFATFNNFNQVGIDNSDEMRIYKAVLNTGYVKIIESRDDLDPDVLFPFTITTADNPYHVTVKLEGTKATITVEPPDILAAEGTRTITVDDPFISSLGEGNVGIMCSRKEVVVSSFEAFDRADEAIAGGNVTIAQGALSADFTLQVASAEAIVGTEGYRVSLVNPPTGTVFGAVNSVAGSVTKDDSQVPLSYVQAQIALAQALVPGYDHLSPGWCDPDYHDYGVPVFISGRSPPDKYILHLGQDVSDVGGTPTKCLVPGVVKYKQGVNSPTNSSEVNNAVTILLGDDGLYWCYGHLNKAAGINVGDRVNEGQQLGTIAGPITGFSEHCHIGALKVDPNSSGNVPGTSIPIQTAIGWGTAYGNTFAQAQQFAEACSSDPVIAYKNWLQPLPPTTEYPAAENTINVSTSAELSAAITNASAGDHIVLANGTYTSTITMSKSGASDTRRIVIRAATKHGAVCSGWWTVSGDFVTIWGIKFTGTNPNRGPDDDLATAYKLSYARNLNLFRCWFTGRNAVSTKGCNDARIGYNRFRPEKPFASGEGETMLNINYRLTDNPDGPFNMRVYRNLFQTAPNFNGSISQSGRDSFAIYGSSFFDASASRLNLMIYDNFFDHIDLTRSIYTKHNGVLLDNNTVIGPGPEIGRNGLFGIRQGSDCHIAGNHVEEHNRIMVGGLRCDVRGNRCVNTFAGITISASNDQPAKQTAANDCRLIGNNAPVIVGVVVESSPFLGNVTRTLIEKHLEADGVTVDVNSSRIERRHETNTTINLTTNFSYPQPVVHTTSTTGPDAPWVG